MSLELIMAMPSSNSTGTSIRGLASRNVPCMSLVSASTNSKGSFFRASATAIFREGAYLAAVKRNSHCSRLFSRSRHNAESKRQGGDVAGVRDRLSERLIIKTGPLSVKCNILMKIMQAAFEGPEQPTCALQGD
jgi:hypothetical protein